VHHECGLTSDRIVIDPDIQHGNPVIGGTRVPITRIIGGLTGGMTYLEIMQDDGVTQEDIAAALDYAAELIRHDRKDHQANP
jgi:uncharacterized protein (DUF433 family)